MKTAARSGSALYLALTEVSTGQVPLSVGAEDSAAAHSGVVRAASVEVEAVDSTVVEVAEASMAVVAAAMVVEAAAVVMVVVVLIRGSLELNQPASESPVFSCLPQLE